LAAYNLVRIRNLTASTAWENHRQPSWHRDVVTFRTCSRTSCFK